MECTPWVYSFGERFSANLWKRQGKGWFVTTIPSQWFKQRGRLLSRITYHCWLVYLNFLSFCVFFLVLVEEEEDELTSSSAAGGVLLDDNWADAMTTFYFNMKCNLNLCSTIFARTIGVLFFPLPHKNNADILSLLHDSCCCMNMKFSPAAAARRPQFSSSSTTTVVSWCWKLEKTNRWIVHTLNKAISMTCFQPTWMFPVSNSSLQSYIYNIPLYQPTQLRMCLSVWHQKYYIAHIPILYVQATGQNNIYVCLYTHQASQCRTTRIHQPSQ